MIISQDYVWAKLIVSPALAPGAQADQTSPWLVIAGDPGCPGIAQHFLAGAEQSSGPFALWLTIFLVRPVTWTGHLRFPRLKDNQVDTMSLCESVPVWRWEKLQPHSCEEGCNGNVDLMSFWFAVWFGISFMPPPAKFSTQTKLDLIWTKVLWKWVLKKI